MSNLGDKSHYDGAGHKCKNKCKINVNNFCGERKKEKKRGKLVIPFLYIETIGVNGVDTLDPHLFSAETDRFPAVSKCLNALQDHVGNGVIR